MMQAQITEQSKQLIVIICGFVDGSSEVQSNYYYDIKEMSFFLERKQDLDNPDSVLGYSSYQSII